MTQDSRVLVVIACDTDQDRGSFVGRENLPEKGLSWRGVEEGVPMFDTRFRDLQDSFGSNLKVLWFIRSDLQMEKIYGDCAWPFENFHNQLLDLKNMGDEIGWHMHFWRWNTQKKGWYAEVHDWEWMQKCIQEGYKAIPEMWKPLHVKGGWCFQTGATLQKFSDLGIKADHSCIPDAWNISYSHMGLPIDIMDWRGSPLKPYHPGPKDHRTPGKREALPIWEVPVSTTRYPLGNVFARFARGIIPYSNGSLAKPRFHLKRHKAAHIGGSPENFSKACREVFNSASERTEILSTFFHPDCLLVDRKSGRYENIDNLAENLETILSVSEETGVPFRFATGSDVLKFLEGNHA